MTNDAATLMQRSNCIMCLAPGQMEAAEVSLVCAWADKAVNSGNFRITEASDIRITEAGDPRIIE